MDRLIKLRMSAAALSLFIIILGPSATAAGIFDFFFKKADFSRVVFIGDSLTAGFQSGGLQSESQNKGYAALVAQQAGFDLSLPLISEPGIPAQFQLENVNPLTIVRPDGVGERINPLEQATNLAVPGHTVNDALFRRPSDTDPITSVVLGFPGIFNGDIRSQAEWAQALSPTFIFLWIGNNDVLAFATSGGTEMLTPIDTFEQDYQELLHQLESTGAELIIANVPDVTSIAFFIPAEAVAERVGQPLSVIGPRLGIQSGDKVTIEGFPLVEQILTGKMLSPLPDDAVLDVEEIAQTQQAHTEVNRIIAREAYRRNIPMVNVNLLFKILETFGLSVKGKHLNTGYLGGLFSLDGVHPTNTAYALIANQFIWKLNFRYRARIKRINVRKVAAQDPLVIPELLPNTRDLITDLFHSDLRYIFKPFKRVMNGSPTMVIDE